MIVLPRRIMFVVQFKENQMVAKKKVPARPAPARRPGKC